MREAFARLLSNTSTLLKHFYKHVMLNQYSAIINVDHGTVILLYLFII